MLPWHVVLRALLAVAFVWGPASAQEQAQAPLVDGSRSDRPGSVRVERNGSFCSGALIAPRVVLTAGHCVDDLESAIVQVGRNDRLIERVFRSTTHDVATLLLDLPVPEATLTMSTRAPAVGEAVTIVGWGGDPNRGPSSAAEVGSSSVVALEGDPTRVGWGPVKHGEFLIRRSACSGDSGAPILDSRGEVLGVISRGLWVEPRGCLEEDALVVATRIDADVAVVLDAFARTSGFLPLERIEPTCGATNVDTQTGWWSFIAVLFVGTRRGRWRGRTETSHPKPSRCRLPD